MTILVRLTPLALCAALLLPLPALAAPDAPPASLKCGPKKVPAQVTKRNGKVVWKCVKPGTVPTEDAADTAPVAPAGTAVTTPRSEPVAATALASNEPVVVRVPISSAPAVPSGLKTTCMTAANTFDSDGTCPVVQYKGLTTWAYSFIDNRVSMALVTYDSNGNVVRNSTLDGARYVWQITLDAANRTAKVWGQGTGTVSAPWTLFAGEAATAPVAASAPPTPETPAIQQFGTAPATSGPQGGITAVTGPSAPCTTTTSNPAPATAVSGTVQIRPADTSNCPN